MYNSSQYRTLFTEHMHAQNMNNHYNDYVSTKSSFNLLAMYWGVGKSRTGTGTGTGKRRVKAGQGRGLGQGNGG